MSCHLMERGASAYVSSANAISCPDDRLQYSQNFSHLKRYVHPTLSAFMRRVFADNVSIFLLGPWFSNNELASLMMMRV